VRLIKPNVPKAIVQHIETASESHCVNPSSTSPGAELVSIGPKSWMSETDRGQVQWLHQNALLQVGFGNCSHHLIQTVCVGVHQGSCRRLSSSKPQPKFSQTPLQIKPSFPAFWLPPLHRRPVLGDQRPLRRLNCSAVRLDAVYIPVEIRAGHWSGWCRVHGRTCESPCAIALCPASPRPRSRFTFALHLSSPVLPPVPAPGAVPSVSSLPPLMPSWRLQMPLASKHDPKTSFRLAG
jgi:hypothetical protein